MNKIEEAEHLRTVFRQLRPDKDATMRLVKRLREKGLEYLPLTVIKKVPKPHFPDIVKAAYEDKGIDIEWNPAKIGETGIAGFFSASRDADLSQSERSAVTLVYHCTEAIQANDVSADVQQLILASYAGLDLDILATGTAFRKGRKMNTGGPIRKKIALEFKKNPSLKNPDLWKEVTQDLPRGWTHYDNRMGEYLEGPTVDKHMTIRRFFTVCGEERKKIAR